MRNTCCAKPVKKAWSLVLESSKLEAQRCSGRLLMGNLLRTEIESESSLKKWKVLSIWIAFVLCIAWKRRCAFSGSSSSPCTTCPSVSSFNVILEVAKSSEDMSSAALCSWMIRSVSKFFCAVFTSASNVRLLLPVFLVGLRSASSSSSSPRFNREVYVAVVVVVVDLLGFGSGTPKSRSGSESLSESELSTTCWPLEVTRLLAPEVAEACDGLKEDSGEWVLVAGGAAAGNTSEDSGAGA
jgi:hypothetical protein